MKNDMILIKKEILKEYLEFLTNDLESAKQALASSRELFSQDDMKQEGKYDTRKTEVGYLIQAQGKRVEELKLDFEAITHFEVKETHKVEIGSLISVIDDEEVEKLYFILPTTLAHSVELNKKKYHLISYTAPLAQAAMTLEKEEYFDILSPKGEVEYFLKEIY